jgi:hypothetical protein
MANEKSQVLTIHMIRLNFENIVLFKKKLIFAK